MRRREFITLLGGVAVVWPLSARAQQTERMRRIGVLMQYSESDPEGRIRAKALEQTLQKFGWIQGRNLQVDYRWADGDGDRFRTHAAELVRLGEDAIVAVSSPAVKALQRETQTIPIIFTQVSDPVAQGIVESMARPGGIVTGFSNYDPAISGKWLELLKQAAPSVRRAAIVFNPKTAPYTRLYVRAIEAVAPSMAVKVTTMPVHDDAEIEVAFTRHAREQGGGLIVMTDTFTSVHRKQIIELAARLALPAIYPYRYYVVDGGLMSYGIDQIQQSQGAAIYLDRILNGAKPGVLPVQAPTKYQLMINLKTAKALGLVISESFLLRADELIE
jgi:putative ABC transport system substrate-binding protein